MRRLGSSIHCASSTYRIAPAAWQARPIRKSAPVLVDQIGPTEQLTQGGRQRAQQGSGRPGRVRQPAARTVAFDLRQPRQ
jgi:hypothetical protein